LQPLRILVVDDEPDVRDVVREYLSQVGHDVDVMPSGREAIDHLGTGVAPYDLALVDWSMPGIGGRDVIQSIAERYPDTVIMITTGQITDALHKQRTAAGGIEVLEKPFSLRDLGRRINDAMEKRRRVPA